MEVVEEEKFRDLMKDNETEGLANCKRSGLVVGNGLEKRDRYEDF